jgi:hypothetical protein
MGFASKKREEHDNGIVDSKEFEHKKERKKAS